MDWKTPLTQKQLEDIVNDELFYDYDENIIARVDTPEDEDNITSKSQVFSINKLDNENKNSINYDDELIAAAKEVEERIILNINNAETSAGTSIDVPAEIVIPDQIFDDNDKENEEVLEANDDEMYNIPSEEEGFSEEDEEQDNDTETEEPTEAAITMPNARKILNRESLREKNRYYREKGKEYKGYKKEGGKFAPVVDRKQRDMLPKCNSKMCIKAKNRHCPEFSEKSRKAIFDKFWSLTWDMKKTYVSALVDVKNTKRPTTNNNSKRTLTFEYHLKKGKQLLQVCKKTFLNTLGLREFMVCNWCLKAESGMHVARDDIEVPLRKRISNKITASLKLMTEFLNSIPKLESHYCRSNTSKLYVEPIYQNKMDLYRVYKIYCQERNVEPVVPSRFKQEIKALNIAIHSPKKDQCDVCVGHQSGNVDEGEYQTHIQRKTEARDAKAEDKKLAQENPEELTIMTMDVQAVKLAPLLQASAIYFKTKLCVHNFTIFDLVTKDCHCYLWHEAEGGLEANIFATILFKHLQNYLEVHPRTKRIILYSDGCGYQNRNNCLANTLLHLANIKNVIVEQKFLEKGHTQMEVDGAHSLIERKLKNQVIYLPSDYIKFCKSARPSQPFTVHYLSHDYFLNFSNVTYYNTIRPGIRRLDPVIVDIRSLKYEKTEISFKLNYKDEYKLLVNKSKKNTKEITKLYKTMLKIKQEKWNHLQALKSVLPKDTHYFYDSLKY